MAKKSKVVVRKATVKSDLSLGKLEAERSALQERVAKLTVAIDALAALETTSPQRAKKSASAKASGDDKTRKGKPTLEVVFRKVLEKHGSKGVTVEQACQEVLDSGYETGSSAFISVVRQLVHKMKSDKTLKVVGKEADGRKNLYAAVA